MGLACRSQSALAESPIRLYSLTETGADHAATTSRARGCLCCVARRSGVTARRWEHLNAGSIVLVTRA
jgi:hypothetical protein